MASMVQGSPRATALSVQVVRTFVELRGILASNKALANKVQVPERKVYTPELILSSWSIRWPNCWQPHRHR